ncbi:MAG: pyridoxamine 5'-phosphate oxidase family protein [Acidobacteria bacterium]|nr:pyridoxamine 5'-phosphate oxidase family protein [Acidobacteriota bacterium]
MDIPYHEGEVAVQRRANESNIAERNGTVIASTIMRGALAFLRQQPMAVLGSQDKEGRLWASLLFGNPGFLEPANDGRSLRILLGEADRQPADPLWRNIAMNRRIGMLVIELGSRRRIRVNGRASLEADQVLLQVDESYPNCPKYIQRRHVHRGAAVRSSQAGDPQQGVTLDPERSALLRRADTFFVATAHPSRGTDASHRGGNPGFVKVLDESTLRIPDYQGNSMFNTLGNLAVNPNAGLVFPDFENQRVLQLAGTAEILWDQADAANESGGTGRFWHFRVEQWLETRLSNSMAWEFLDYSPYNPKASQ